VRQLLQAVGGAKARPQPKVIHRQHIRAPEVEYQEHLHRPAADAAHLGEALDDRFVFERAQGVAIGDHSLKRLGGEVLQRRDLGEREAGGPQRFGRSVEDRLRRRKTAVATGLHQAPQYGVGRDTVELLMGDGVGEGLEGLTVGARLESQGTHRADQGAEYRVGAAQVRNDVLAHRVLAVAAAQRWQCGQ